MFYSEMLLDGVVLFPAELAENRRRITWWFCFPRKSQKIAEE